mmetsp:Transcript_16639/g.53084  ORF Transcript_16639/g.53084 Transcript_16639/m.53084 type:complete len:256 (-) Transcript_16639:549-1316(-)
MSSERSIASASRSAVSSNATSTTVTRSRRLPSRPMPGSRRTPSGYLDFMCTRSMMEVTSLSPISRCCRYGQVASRSPSASAVSSWKRPASCSGSPRCAIRRMERKISSTVSALTPRSAVSGAVSTAAALALLAAGCRERATSRDRCGKARLRMSSKLLIITNDGLVSAASRAMTAWKPDAVTKACMTRSCSGEANSSGRSTTTCPVESSSSWMAGSHGRRSGVFLPMRPLERLLGTSRRRERRAIHSSLELDMPR